MRGGLLSAHLACRVVFAVDLGVASDFLPALFDQLDSKNGVDRG